MKIKLVPFLFLALSTLAAACNPMEQLDDGLSEPSNGPCRTLGGCDGE